MKKRILLVEDNLATVELMEEELRFLGYDVVVAKNGLEAVEIATSILPDLIIMDIAMPEMNGIQATSQIRINPKTKAIPILVATAKVMPGDREVFLAAGCDDYLAKPFTHRELGVHIDTLLKQKG